MNHSGPCRYPSDVEQLYHSLLTKGTAQLSNALRNEVRYQKMILGVPGEQRLSKSAEELCNMLKDHLSTSAPEETLEEAPATESFCYSRPGTWVAIYYDDNFYVGQVIVVDSPDIAQITFLEKTKLHPDHFRRSRAENIAKVESKYVFSADFDVQPVTTDYRVWRVDNVSSLKEVYGRIKKQSS